MGRKCGKYHEDSVLYSIEGISCLKTVRNDVETTYPLRETTRQEILKRRIESIPTFVLKVGNDFYLADVYDLRRLTVNLKQKEHLCCDCANCRAVLEQLGGCNKVRDCSPRIYLQYDNTWEEVIKLSKRIEKYPFVKYGYETFGIEPIDEVLCVEECAHFTLQSKKSRREQRLLIEQQLLKESIRLKNTIFF